MTRPLQPNHRVGVFQLSTTKGAKIKPVHRRRFGRQSRDQPRPAHTVWWIPPQPKWWIPGYRFCRIAFTIDRAAVILNGPGPGSRFPSAAYGCDRHAPIRQFPKQRSGGQSNANGNADRRTCGPCAADTSRTNRPSDDARCNPRRISPYTHTEGPSRGGRAKARKIWAHKLVEGSRSCNQNVHDGSDWA